MLTFYSHNFFLIFHKNEKGQFCLLCRADLFKESPESLLKLLDLAWQKSSYNRHRGTNTQNTY